MKRLATIVLTVTLLAGCQAVQRGTTLVRWDKGGADSRMTIADTTTQYGLYGSTDVTPIGVYDVNKGDQLGFQKAGDKIIAIAGANRITLPDGTYYWNRR